MTSHRDPASGALVDNRYRLVAPLGEGTFGAVWRAQDTRLSGRSVAVKFLKPEFLAHPEAVTRFEAEADALAQVQHPNVVGVHDRGQWGDTHYLVTEFVEGRPLTAWIEDHRARRSYPDVGAALLLFDQVCAGLEAAHAVRAPGPIVHRDLKPENILVRVQANGEPLVKILDFGIAQLGGRTGTRTGALMGTPLYMAPEQALGNTAAIAPSTDVFALGVVLAEMLTLRAQVDVSEPWWGTTMQRGLEVRGLLAAMRTDVPPALVDVIAKALSSRGIDRYADAGALRVALRSVTSHTVSAVAMASTQLAPRVQAPPGLPATVVGGPAPAIVRTVLSVPPPIANSSTAPMMRDVARPPARPKLLVMSLVGAAAIAGVGVTVLAQRGTESTASQSAVTAPVLPATPASPIAPAVTATAPTLPSTPALAIVPPVAIVPAITLPPAQVTDQNNSALHPLDSDPDLQRFLHGWLAALRSPGRSLDAIYAPQVSCHASLVEVDHIRTVWDGKLERGGSLDIDWDRVLWRHEDPNAADAPRVCREMPGAIGDTMALRAWAVEVEPQRSPRIGCPRLEGIYILRVRHVADGLRICHETWSLREGICASCPTAVVCR